MPGANPTYGARPLRRAMNTMIEDQLAEVVLRGKLKEGDSLTMAQAPDDGHAQGAAPGGLSLGSMVVRWGVVGGPCMAEVVM